jgi:CheY-like chemotaxis protein
MTQSEAGRPFAVLVVEDDAILRLHALDIVEEAGFTAIEAKNADEAIAILERRSDIVLLYTDINMPGSMDGLKLAHAVRDRWPPIKIVVVSGQVQVDQNDLPSDSRFFGKPFEAQQMISELRDLIAK